MKVKKRISLVIALMMLMTVFAVPTLAYGKENKAKAAPKSEGTGYYITNNSEGGGSIDEIYMDLDDSVQLFLFSMSTPIKTLPEGWSWESSDPETVTVTAEGLLQAVSRDYAYIMVKNEAGDVMATLDVYCGYDESYGYVVEPAGNFSFKNNPYADEYEALYTTLGTSSGNNTIALKIASNNGDEVNQTDWIWSATSYDDNEDQIVSFAKPTADGVIVTGKQSGIVKISAYNETENWESSSLTVYVGDAYDWYIVDEADKQEGFVGVNNTLNLKIKMIPENAAVPDFNLSIEDSYEEPMAGIAKAEKVGDHIVLTGIAESEQSIYLYAYAQNGDEKYWSSPYCFIAGSERYWMDNGSIEYVFRLYPRSRTAKIEGYDIYDDTIKTLTVPSSITAAKDAVYNPGTYTVTAIGEDTFIGDDLTSITIPNTITSIGAYAVGYDRFENGSEKKIYTKIPNFVIYGYSPTSAAASYAAANGFRYINIGSKPAQSISGASSFTKAYGSKAFNLGASASNGGALTYSSSNTKVAAVSANGTVTIKGTGKAAITITASATDVYGGGSKTVNITITPKKVAGIKAKAGKKSMTVSWKKDTRASGYQITYAQNKKLTKGKKNVTVSKNKTTKKAIKKLKSKKTYYVKVRAYKKAGSQKLYGTYSAVKKVKVK